MDSNPSAQFLLDIGERHIIVEMSKELGESKRIPIPGLNFFLTLEKDTVTVAKPVTVTTLTVREKNGLSLLLSLAILIHH